MPDEQRARRLIEARLGRPPQDALEAAVVLEAWAGVPAQRALETARALMPARPRAALVSRAAPAPAAHAPRGIFSGLAFVLAIAMVALWAAPLADALGADVVRAALVFSLPVTLGLQWALGCRHLGRPSGLAGLAARRGTLVVAAAALIGSGAVFGPGGTLAGLLVVTWTAGTILIHRGWAGAYAAVVAGGTLLLAAAVAAPAVVSGAAAGVAALAWAALRTTAPGAAIPGRWTRTAGAALTGTGLGVLLVADPTVSWTGSAAPALALLPSALGALWAGRHLRQLAGAFPRALAGVPACPSRESCGDGRRHGHGSVISSGPAERGLRSDRRDAVAASLRGAAFAPARALAGALARLAGATIAGSAALVVLAPWGADAVGVLAGFGVVAAAMLLTGLIDSLGRPALAGVGVAAGVAIALLVDPWFPGAGLLCGGALAVALLAPAALVLLLRPARTLATTLWIT
jgi:hypothetical protein